MNGVALERGEGRPAHGAGLQWSRSIAWLLFLGPFFFLSYGATNQWAAEQAAVGSVRFDWEEAIPFLPWTIVPYWSIDLLYGLSFLMCRSAREVDRHGLRLLTVQLVAVGCFLLFPLRFAAGQPEVGGPGAAFFAPLFDALRSFDQPFNQAPSLHIGLLVVIWAQFAWRTRGAWRCLVHIWASLIAVSVLTTFQHHFIDVPTGVLVGALALWLWPARDTPPLAGFQPTREPKRRQLAARYAAGAVLFALPAVGGGAWLWSLWVSTSLALVSLIHFGRGATGFQKTKRRHSIAVRILLAPYLLAARINQRIWSRRKPDRDLVRDGVWIGALPARIEPIDGHLPAIVDLTAELPAPAGAAVYDRQGWLDLVPPSPEALARVAKHVDALRSSGPVLVCCALGYGRSAAAVAAWLLQTGRARDAGDALATLHACRPRIALTHAHVHALEQMTTVPTRP